MCQVHSVIIVIKLNCECQCIVVEGTLPLHRVRVVAHVFAAAHPSAIVPLRIDLGVQERLHAVVV